MRFKSLISGLISLNSFMPCLYDSVPKGPYLVEIRIDMQSPFRTVYFAEYVFRASGVLGMFIKGTVTTPEDCPGMEPCFNFFKGIIICWPGRTRSTLCICGFIRLNILKNSGKSFWAISPFCLKSLKIQSSFFTT